MEPKLYIETLHYNNYINSPINVRKFKLGRYSSDKIEEIPEDIKFINFDEAGLKSGILKLIKEKYNEKSKYEK